MERRRRPPQLDGYRTRVWSPGGRLVLERKLAFSEFGTFASEIDLPVSAELGTWQIGVDCPGHDELVFRSSFEAFGSIAWPRPPDWRTW